MTANSTRIRIWDLPTRIAHWLMVICFGVSWWSGEARLLDYHRYSGYTLLGLLLFRVCWGFIGSQTSRFASFIRGPAVTLAYLRSLPNRAAPAIPGHNPLGAWSVVAMLVLLVTQVVLGLFSVDVDGIESGPLSDRVSFDAGRMCAHFHHIVFNVLLGMAALHLAAVVFYFAYKRHNLVGPMISGEGEFENGGTSLRFAPLWRAAIVIIVSVAVVWLVTNGLRFS